MRLNDLPAITSVAGRKRFWKTTEDALLREHYTTHGPEYCTTLLGRSTSSVYSRAHALGLKPPPVVRKGGPRMRWHTTEEIDALIRAAWLDPDKGYALRAAIQVGRPKWWVCKRAIALGLAQPVLRQPEWTPAEDELVRSLAHLAPANIARKMKAAGHPRSPAAVTVRLKRLGVSRRQARLDEGVLSANQLAGVMGVDVKTVLRWIERENLPAVRRQMNDDEASRGSYEIAAPRLRSWLAGHAALVDLRKVDKYWFFDLVFDVRGNAGWAPR